MVKKKDLGKELEFSIFGYWTADQIFEFFLKQFEDAHLGFTKL